MDVKFSKNQEKAINDRGKSLVLSASAGSGKTTVLVERVLKLVCEEKVSIENLCVVTFTNAAAAGIKSKLRKKLSERLSKNPDDEHIRKQLLLVSDADISTVHSFCGRLIKKYGYALKREISSSVRLSDDTEDKLLRQQIMEELIDDCYYRNDDDFVTMIECLSPGRNDDGLIAIMLKTYDYICSIPFYEKWVEESLKDFGETENFLVSPIGSELEKQLDSILFSAVSKYRAAVEHVEVTEGLENQADIYKSEYGILKNAYHEEGYNEKIRILNGLRFEKLPPAKRGSDTSVSASVRDKVKKAINGFLDKYGVFVFPDEENKKALEKFFTLILEFDRLYKDKKYEMGTITFNDQEHLAIELLGNDAIADEISEKYTEVMVDEFQDTNSVQDYIFERISRKNNLFTVGDVKQSIYRFRHANPAIFTKKILMEDENKETIYLNENFRSSDNVAEFANLVCAFLMSREVSPIDYMKTDMLVPKKGVKEERFIPEVYICSSKKDAEDGITADEAEVIAVKINEMITDPYFLLPPENRRLRYSDVVILVRSFNDKTLKLLSDLSALGIPVRYDDKINLFDTAEIKTVASFLRVTDNPVDDISMLAVLRNVFELSDAYLFDLRRENPGMDFFSIIKKERKDIYETLASFRSFGLKYTVSELIRKIYDDFMLPEKWTAMYGVSRRDNLKKLLMLAEDFEAGGFVGVGAFVKYMNKIIETGKKLPSNDIGGEISGDYVRVMSIHRSKGLEFPVVFLSGCGSRLNKRDLSEQILTESSLGIGAVNVDSMKRIKSSTSQRDIISSSKLFEAICEEVRLIYVALTRAEFKTVVTGSVEKPEKRLAEYAASCYNSRFGMSYIDFIKVNTLLDLIMPPLMFTKAMDGYGKNIPKELCGSISDISMKFEIYESRGNLLKEQEDNARYLGMHIPRMEYREVKKVFSYSSPYGNMPAKISVTALNSMTENSTYVVAPAPELYVPDFLADAKMSERRRGTMLHYIFEKIDIEKLKETRNVLSEVERIMEKNPVIWENLNIEDLSKIESFFESPLGIKMLRSDNIFREKEFLIHLDSGEVYNGKAGKKIMVQGIIDCCFTDNMGELWLIDYKYTCLSEEKLKEKYSYQLELYKTAASKVFGVETGKIHTYIWDIKKCVSYKI